MSQFFTSGDQSIGVSASASVLPMNTQDWSPLGWAGWISLQSKVLSRSGQYNNRISIFHYRLVFSLLRQLRSAQAWMEALSKRDLVGFSSFSLMCTVPFLPYFEMKSAISDQFQGRRWEGLWNSRMELGKVLLDECCPQKAADSTDGPTWFWALSEFSGYPPLGSSYLQSIIKSVLPSKTSPSLTN